MKHMSNPVDVIQKPMATEEDLAFKPLRRKAGSGHRVTTVPVETQSSGKQLIPHGIHQNGTGSFLKAKHTMHQGIQHIKRKSNKAMGDIQGIILNNIKASDAQSNQGSGGIRQIKHLQSNPGSRVGSQKAAQRIGDQTTCIKKGANDAHANPEKFVGSIFKQAPKIGGVGIRVNKEGS